MANPELEQTRETGAIVEEIERLARETGYAIPVARRIYESEYAKLKLDATVTGFLTVLALRHTGDVLHARSRDRRASEGEERSLDLFAA
jgi:hypothetical protein